MIPHATPIFSEGGVHPRVAWAGPRGFKGLFRRVMHLCRAWWYGWATDTYLGRPSHGQLLQFPFYHVLKQTSDEATPTLEPYGGQVIRGGVRVENALLSGRGNNGAADGWVVSHNRLEIRLWDTETLLARRQAMTEALEEHPEFFFFEAGS